MGTYVCGVYVYICQYIEKYKNINLFGSKFSINTDDYSIGT